MSGIAFVVCDSKAAVLIEDFKQSAAVERKKRSGILQFTRFFSSLNCVAHERTPMSILLKIAIFIEIVLFIAMITMTMMMMDVRDDRFETWNFVSNVMKLLNIHEINRIEFN